MIFMCSLSSSKESFLFFSVLNFVYLIKINRLPCNRQPGLNPQQPIWSPESTRSEHRSRSNL